MRDLGGAAHPLPSPAQESLNLGYKNVTLTLYIFVISWSLCSSSLSSIFT
jgi:hypothetical protein